VALYSVTRIRTRDESPEIPAVFSIPKSWDSAFPNPGISVLKNGHKIAQLAPKSRRDFNLRSFAQHHLQQHARHMHVRPTCIFFTLSRQQIVIGLGYWTYVARIIGFVAVNPVFSAWSRNASGISGSRDYKTLNPESRDWENRSGFAVPNQNVLFTEATETANVQAAREMLMKNTSLSFLATIYSRAYAIVLLYYSATYWVFCVFYEKYTKQSVGLLWKIRQNQTADAFQLIYFSMGLLRFIGIKPYRYENISCVYFNKTVRKMSPKIGTTLLIHRRTSGYSTSH